MNRILIVEDEHALGRALELAVRRLGHVPVLAASGAQAKKHLENGHFDAVVLDIGLPDMSGVDILEWIRAAGSMIPVLIVTAHATLDHVIAAQKLGVADHLIKPLDLTRFEQAVDALVARGGWVADPGEVAATTLIGAAPGMHGVFLAVAKACAGEMPVLISGPSGSGKTLAARVIHNNSARSNGPLRLVECHALRDAASVQSLLERGDGSIVLENPGALTVEVQSVLAEQVAGGMSHLPRLIATTREPLAELVEKGSLREDLFYTFSALAVKMPPLAERAGDIPALGRFFCGLDGGGRSMEISGAAMSALQSYTWPGNVRELRHVLEHARSMSRGGTVFPGHLPPHVAEAWHGQGKSSVSGELENAVARWLDSHLDFTPEQEWRYDVILDQVETTMLRHLLRRFGNRPTHLAGALGMNRATLRQKLRRLGMRESD